MENTQQYILMYSEGPGTSRYEAARGTKTECDAFMGAHGNSRAVWEMIKVQPDTDLSRLPEGGRGIDRRMERVRRERAGRDAS